MKQGLVIALVVLVAAAAVIGVFLLTDDAKVPSMLLSCGQSQEGEMDKTAPTKAGSSNAAFENLGTESEREAFIRELGGKPGTAWNDPILRRAIVGDPSEKVQGAALEESIKLARKAGGDAPTGAVRLGLGSNKGNTRAAALKAAREHADPKFVQELIQLVDDGDPYATMALNALAYTQSERAHAKVSEIAHDESAEPKLRQRAIALLAITKDKEALPLLRDLVNGQDKTLAAIAEEVIKAMR
ncbi:MAG: HEAT repeat domain-containing protein [Planctomycetes bacterium]|nr:HEAT repeat domain-containing protein [Planctomycetota bacterium]MCW8134417.1 HEAT repeat domain-containing protein [Planctomycetota bacterium]